MPEGAGIPTLRRHFRFQWEEAQGCYVLLYPEGMISLNGSAGEILSCCDGKRSVDEIISELTRRFPRAVDLPADTREFLTVAHEQQWIDFY